MFRKIWEMLFRSHPTWYCTYNLMVLIHPDTCLFQKMYKLRPTEWQQQGEKVKSPWPQDEQRWSNMATVRGLAKPVPTGSRHQLRSLSSGMYVQMTATRWTNLSCSPLPTFAGQMLVGQLGDIWWRIFSYDTFCTGNSTGTVYHTQSRVFTFMKTWGFLKTWRLTY